MKAPYVSVIIPVYNMAATLSDSVHSIISQSINTIEIIIINDGSTDNTDQIIEKLQVNNLHIISLKQPHSGKIAAMNRGIIVSQAEFITFVDADDTLPPDSIQNRVKFLVENPDVVAVYGNANYMNKNARIYRLRRSRNIMSMTDIVSHLYAPVVGPTLMIRKNILIRAGVLDTSIQRAVDKYLLLELYSRGPLFHIDLTVYNYRTYPRQDTLVSRTRQWYDLCRLLFRYFTGYEIPFLIAKQTLFHVLKLGYELIFWKK